MANWDKLDEEFYSVINSMTEDQWKHWEQRQSENQKLRALDKAMRLQLHLAKLNAKPLQNEVNILLQPFGSQKLAKIDEFVIKSVIVETSSEFALAA